MFKISLVHFQNSSSLNNSSIIKTLEDLLPQLSSTASPLFFPHSYVLCSHFSTPTLKHYIPTVLPPLSSTASPLFYPHPWILRPHCASPTLTRCVPTFLPLPLKLCSTLLPPPSNAPHPTLFRAGCPLPYIHPHSYPYKKKCIASPSNSEVSDSARDAGHW